MTSLNYDRVPIKAIPSDEPTYFVDGILTTILSKDTGEASYSHDIRTEWVLSRSYISLEEEREPSDIIASMVVYSRIHVNKAFGNDNIPTYPQEVEEQYAAYNEIHPYVV
jgi:hypothetical protein